MPFTNGSSALLSVLLFTNGLSALLCILHFATGARLDSFSSALLSVLPFTIGARLVGLSSFSSALLSVLPFTTGAGLDSLVVGISVDSWSASDPTIFVVDSRNLTAAGIIDFTNRSSPTSDFAGIETSWVDSLLTATFNLEFCPFFSVTSDVTNWMSSLTDHS